MNKRSKNRFIAVVTAAITMGIAGGSAIAGGFLDVDFEDAEFTFPLRINNPYWQLNQDGGTTHQYFTYTADTEDECVVNTVFVNGAEPYYSGIAKTKVITVLIEDEEGEPTIEKPITALQVMDIEWIDVDCNGDGDVETEVTLDWYAQDENGNIWYMGELSRSFDPDDKCDEGTFDQTVDPSAGEECYEGSWEAGKFSGEDGDMVLGMPGIVVPSDTPFGPDGEPLSNGTYYFQEIAYEAEDMAKILRQDASLVIDNDELPGDYDFCRKVKAWNPFEPGESVEHKWYCTDGPGLVLIEGVGGGRTEVETLVEVGP